MTNVEQSKEKTNAWVTLRNNKHDKQQKNIWLIYNFIKYYYGMNTMKKCLKPCKQKTILHDLNHDFIWISLITGDTFLKKIMCNVKVNFLPINIVDVVSTIKLLI